MAIKFLADLHVHTTYSSDSVITPKDLIYYAKKMGLNAVAVTDHNSLEGAYKIAAETDFFVIPGMEVSSADGHIVALNVRELVPRGLSASETIERIHAAGGIAIACHPHVYFKSGLGAAVNASFDAIEVINARAFPFGRSVRLAKADATRFGLPQVAGTDAHFGPQIGYGYTEIEAEKATAEAVARAIVSGRCSAHGGAVPASTNFGLTVARLKRKIKHA
jgi:predicted metal-dependent phosphoesterase TrpH